MSVKRFCLLLMGVGLILSAVAVWWWQDFYGEVAANTGTELGDYTECLYRSGDICGVVAATGEFFGMSAYEPFLLWLGAGIFAAGLLIRLIVR